MIILNKKDVINAIAPGRGGFHNSQNNPQAKQFAKSDHNHNKPWKWVQVNKHNTLFFPSKFTNPTRQRFQNARQVIYFVLCFIKKKDVQDLRWAPQNPVLARSSIVKLVPIREIVTQSMILINFKLNESVIIYWVIVFLSVLFQPSSHKQIHTQEEEICPLFSFVASNNIIRDFFLVHSQKNTEEINRKRKSYPPQKSQQKAQPNKIELVVQSYTITTTNTKTNKHYKNKI